MRESTKVTRAGLTSIDLASVVHVKHYRIEFGGHRARGELAQPPTARSRAAGGELHSRLVKGELDLLRFHHYFFSVHSPASSGTAL